MTKTLNQKGQILLLAFVTLGVVLFTVLYVASGSLTFFQNAQYKYEAEQATALAEAGIDKALASLNATWGMYNGETETMFGEGSYSVVVSGSQPRIKTLTVTGYIPNRTNPKVKRTISIQASGLASVFTLVPGTYQVK